MRASTAARPSVIPSFVRNTWPLGRHEFAMLAALYASFTAAWVAVGWLLTRPLRNSFIGRADRSLAEWFVARRTSRWDALSYVGSMLSDTVVKVVVTAIVISVMLVVWRRWLEPLMVAIPLILEALCFITITSLVGRDRPDVEHLDSSPIGSSYPSGHTAAAVAYFAIVVVVFWRTRRLWVRVTATTIATIVATWAGVSRLYRGMHYLTDVLFGVVLGAVCVVATVIVMRRAKRVAAQ